MAVLPPFFLDAVVAIGFVVNGKTTYVATGFLLGRLERTEDNGDRRFRIFLVTNKHVFAGQPQAYVRFNPDSGDDAREYDIPLLTSNGATAWVTHPTKDVDLAVIGINAALLQEHGIRFRFFENDRHVLSLASAKEKGLSEGDGVFALGFPMGMIGEKRDFVIVRQGSIARIQDALNGASNEILIDMTIFPGNSGGPVVTRPELVSIEGTQPIGNASLVGVISSYVPYQDVAISLQTKRPRVIFEENSGLASVVPVDRLLEIVDHAVQEIESASTPNAVDNRESTTVDDNQKESPDSAPGS
jgi:S1-C subfamily serine protease